MTRERLDLGKAGEDFALKKIKKLGYKCIERNYRCALGEIDIIAKHADYLVFIEIKTRKGRDTGYAKEAVTYRKMRQISKTALNYMKEKGCYDTKSRFDVIAVSINQGKPDIEVIQNAFELVY
ncbi:MAG: YraN family protein [Deltaproteobacteria bacterium]|nr:YraN family protein [Deltaproteobacteria bacterium]